MRQCLLWILLQWCIDGQLSKWNLDYREYQRPHSQQFGYNVASQSVRSVRPNETKTTMAYSSNLRKDNEYSNWRSSHYGSMQYAPNAPVSSYNEELTFLCHGSHTEPCLDTKVGPIGLLLALTIHAILEGLAIGLQKKPAEVRKIIKFWVSWKFVKGFFFFFITRSFQLIIE